MNIQGKYRIKVHSLKISCIIEIYATFMSCRTLIFFLSMFFFTPTKCVLRTSSLSHSSGRNDKSLSFIGHGMLLTHHAYCFIIESNQETHFLVNIYQKTDFYKNPQDTGTWPDKQAQNEYQDLKTKKIYYKARLKIPRALYNNN